MRPRFLASAAILCGASIAVAQPAPSLGSADSFVILAHAGVVDRGSITTTVSGNVGCPAGVPKSIAPNPGATFVKESIVERAQRDNAALYNDLAGRRCSDPLTEFPATLLPNRVYCFAADAKLDGTLTLDGTRNDFWFIQIPGALTLGRDAAIVLQNDALSSHVFWTVDSATLGRNSGFAGNLLARNDIAFDRGVTLAGRALSQQGTVAFGDDAINLCGKLIAIAPQTLPDGTIGCPYPQPAIVPSGCEPPFTLEVIGDDDGVLAGKPRKTGTFEFAIRATAPCAVGIRFYTVTIYSSVIQPPPLPPGNVCDLYNDPFQPTGGSGQYNIELTGLPPDLSPAISGIPRLKGDFPITATITDTVSGCSITAQYRLHIGCDVKTVASLPNGKVCQPYHGSVKPSCPGSFTVTSGPLPPGLVLDRSTGEISGTPTTPSTSPLAIQIDHSSGCTVTDNFTIKIEPEDPKQPTTINGTFCIPLYAPIDCTIVDPLPPGTFVDGGALQGTPSTIGNFCVLAKCNGCPTTKKYEIVIGCPATVLRYVLPHVLPFYKPVDIVLCRPELKECLPCTVDQSTLPPGLHMVGDHLMGLPDTLGKYHIKVTATDMNNVCPIVDIYCLEIIDPPLCEPSITISPASTTFFGAIGVPIPAQAFTATGGTAPYAYDVVVPALPPGLSLSLAGVLTGTPTMPGRFNFAVRATDAAGTPGCPQVYSMEIAN